MIDKIEFKTKDFKVKDSAPLIIKNGSTDYQTGEVTQYELFYNESNKIVRGGSAYYNSGLYQLDININGMKVTFNPNQIYYSNNYFSVNEKECQSVLSLIERDLNNNGFMLNMKDARLNRVDVVKQVQTEKPFIQYAPVYRYLSAKRMRRQDFGTTYNYGNKSREIEFYDKIQQLKDVKKFKDREFKYFNIDQTQNMTRCELREKKDKVISRDLGINCISDFYMTGIFEHLTNRYRAIVSNLVFKKGIDESQMRFDFANELELLASYKEAFSTSEAIKLYIICQFGGLDSLIEHYGALDNFRELLLNAGYARTSVWRSLGSLEKGFTIAQGFKELKNSSSIPVMYSELYDKLMAA